MKEARPECVFPEQQPRRKENAVWIFFVNFEAQPFDFGHVVKLTARARFCLQSIRAGQSDVLLSFFLNFVAQSLKFFHTLEPSRVNRADGNKNELLKPSAEEPLSRKQKVNPLTKLSY